MRSLRLHKRNRTCRPRFSALIPNDMTMSNQQKTEEARTPLTDSEGIDRLDDSRPTPVPQALVRLVGIARDNADFATRQRQNAAQMEMQNGKQR